MEFKEKAVLVSSLDNWKILTFTIVMMTKLIPEFHITV